ncbi:MAG: hypothetical protein KKB81_05990 [Candidatus Margulisbacteria bacterium]|nr:hypothetical protein [Candidatus Margulisiibacteriota bacterium]MBU1021411.1 hypothetical protein [Candidatus Margulisiibacteriota bacterium]MBU1728332.1 hypothetical protein [Candidatus Margulisiibacteriota bacterium]MBU1955925.1 hypothetical protein [Candidatus Margulisiibacteriota bacterium]
MYNQIAIIGSKEIVKPLKILGLAAFEAEVPHVFSEVAEKIAKSRDYGIVFLDETLAKESPEAFARLQKDKNVTLSLTPTLAGAKGLSREITAGLIKQAIGFNFET